MRIPIDTNADMKCCKFCRYFTYDDLTQYGYCNRFSVEIECDLDQLFEGKVQEYVREHSQNIPEDTLQRIRSLVSSKKQSTLSELFDQTKDVMDNNYCDTLYDYLKYALEVKGKVRVKEDFYCKNWE